MRSVEICACVVKKIKAALHVLCFLAPRPGSSIFCQGFSPVRMRAVGLCACVVKRSEAEIVLMPCEGFVSSSRRSVRDCACSEGFPHVDLLALVGFELDTLLTKS